MASRVYFAAPIAFELQRAELIEANANSGAIVQELMTERAELIEALTPFAKSAQREREPYPSLARASALLVKLGVKL